MQDTIPEYASVRDIGQRFGISRSTQYRLLEAGHIESIKVGKSRRIITASVKRYFESLRTPKPE
ncbi:excisionase family DNA-binding protein [Gluconobacter japonicus]|uniref:excisionase family DNA-binding protein n=1 Tax=Gluconobacter japonicus TaxID=376620 RepID=UPI0012E94247|nr:excisionase family DNA-binding protein [Gluconobacter japonicus]